MLAEAVEKVLSERGWSIRAAQNFTGVHFNRINRMRAGLNVEAEAVARFAYRIAEPNKEFETVLRWLKLANKDDMVSILGAISSAARSVPESAKTTVVLPSGVEVIVLPSGREFKATAETLAMIETLLLTFEQVEKDYE